MAATDTNEEYDLLVIGGGSAGLSAATLAGTLGARVLLVERHALGGDCLHNGSVPSKTLLASARLAQRMRECARFGLAPVDVQVDFEQITARIREVQAKIAAREAPPLLAEHHNVEVRFAEARFVSSHDVLVGEEEVRAKQIIIATGSRVHAPPIPGLDETGYLDHTRLFTATSLPNKLVVIGGGPLGCEMGQALSRLGSRVTILQRESRLLTREDVEASKILLEQLTSEGIDVRVGATAVGVEPAQDDSGGGGKVVKASIGGDIHALPCDEVLVAVGRRPNIDALDLHLAGVETQSHGIVVDDALMTSQSHIYAIGDCNGGPQFTHWAEHEARVATRNALFAGKEKRRLDQVPWVTFTDPEVARIGLTEYEAQEEHGGETETVRVSMAHVDRAICDGREAGFLKVIADRKGRVLGVHAVGHAAAELLPEWALVMSHGMHIGDLGKTVHVYPTYACANGRLANKRFYAHGLPEWQRKIFAKF